MNSIDQLIEQGVRGVAKRTSRRGFLERIGALIAGTAVTLPLLPVARGEQASEAAGDEDGSSAIKETGDPLSCDYWRYCAIDGFLCGCCGGSHDACPPGSQMSRVTWIGTCENPADGKSYIISYNDCCGKSSCGNCLCNRNERDRPIYRSPTANDINWCLDTDSAIYHCTTARLIGLALDQ